MTRHQDSMQQTSCLNNLYEALSFKLVQMDHQEHCERMGQDTAVTHVKDHCRTRVR